MSHKDFLHLRESTDAIHAHFPSTHSNIVISIDFIGNSLLARVSECVCVCMCVCLWPDMFANASPSKRRAHCASDLLKFCFLFHSILLSLVWLWSFGLHGLLTAVIQGGTGVTVIDNHLQD